MSDEVAAIDRGDVEGRQGLAGDGVVPVEEVPLIAPQLLHRIDRAGGAVQQLADAQIPKVICGQIGQQHQAHVRRTGPMGHAALWLFLEIVGWQPVLLRPDEHLEVPPGAPGDPTQELCVCVGESCRAGP